MSGGLIKACEITLLEDDRPIARGMVAIDSEGVPPAIVLDGDVFLPVYQTAELMPESQTYRKARVMHAGPSFRPVVLTVVNR